MIDIHCKNIVGRPHKERIQNQKERKMLISLLYSAILDNTVKYDVKALRRIKSQLYELVKTNKPTEKLYVATNIDDDSQDVDFVVGVGVYGKFGKVGYRGIKAEELYLYAIDQSDLQYDDDMILKEATSV